MSQSRSVSDHLDVGVDRMGLPGGQEARWIVTGSDDIARAGHVSPAIEMEMAHAIIWLWFCRKATGVLENAFRAGVMDELFSPDQSLDHDDFAPGAEAIGQLNSSYV